MLTITKPVPYGYKSIHDLPTPPNTSRPSPPLIYQDSVHRNPSSLPRSRSPPSQLMSGSYRGLPPPAAMSSGQPLPPGAGSHVPPPPPPPSSGPLPHGQGPPPPPQSASHTQQPQQQQQHHPLSQHMQQLPPHPGWNTEESMRAWLYAKGEEEKRRQEEERTRQENYRAEQRKTEYDILRAALQGGVPPPAVPMIFAGMGGLNAPPAVLEWAQQFAAQQMHPQQLLPGPGSPDHRRDSHPQAYGHYSGSGGVPSTPGSAQGVHGGFVGGGYPGSPRTRGYTMPVSGSRPMAPGSGLSSLNTSVLPSQGAAAAVAAQAHPGVASAQQQLQQQQQQQQQQQEQQSPSIYFHMWQPPTSQGSQSGSNQPATPSVGESPRKRKAAGPQQAAPPPNTQQRFRSPPYAQQSSAAISNPPPGRRRGHSRQTSDASTTYRRGRAETIGSMRAMSPMSTSGPGGSGSGREAAGTPAEPTSFSQGPTVQTRHAAHSVSSLLSSDDNTQTVHYPPTTAAAAAAAAGSAQAADTRGQGRMDSRQGSPHSSEERQRAGGAGSGSAAPRERGDE